MAKPESNIIAELDELINIFENISVSKTEEVEVPKAAPKKEEVAVPASAPLNLTTGHRSHTCGELRISNVGDTVKLTGWVQKCRNQGSIAFLDLRDRYGITQCLFDSGNDAYKIASKCGREYVVCIEGKVVERSNKNPHRPTGDIEIVAHGCTVLNESKEPPFQIKDKTDAKREELRMEYRYLDIRRNPIKEALLLRNKVGNLVRNYLFNQNFCEIETPCLIKSTPEGARDFVVPSRMNPGQFYALPQSPQTFKQLLMVAGMDRYFQIVRCFRDEELRADRQPEFTQIDCEMSFVKQDDILNMFEGLIRHVFQEITKHDFPPFERMTYDTAMKEYGIDKPDLRFGMKLNEIQDIIQPCGIAPIDAAELIVCIKLDGVCNKGGPYASKKKIKKDLTKLATGQRVGASGMTWCIVKEGGKFDSNANKNMDQEKLGAWAKRLNAEAGDLLIAFAGDAMKTREQMGKMRAELGTKLGFRGTDKGYHGLWVVDFPLVEFDEEDNRWTAMHHPFTSPKDEDFELMKTDPGAVRANAYDMVINGTEVGGGSIRIHDKELQQTVFGLLGFTEEAAQEQFGFLMNAFEYGAPPHGGLAFGFDRLCCLLGGGIGLPCDSIRDYIAFPKNNQGRDVMLNAPSYIDAKQYEELKIASTVEVKNKTENAI